MSFLANISEKPIYRSFIWRILKCWILSWSSNFDLDYLHWFFLHLFKIFFQNIFQDFIVLVLLLILVLVKIYLVMWRQNKTWCKIENILFKFDMIGQKRESKFILWLLMWLIVKGNCFIWILRIRVLCISITLLEEWEDVSNGQQIQ